MRNINANAVIFVHGIIFIDTNLYMLNRINITINNGE